MLLTSRAIYSLCSTLELRGRLGGGLPQAVESPMGGLFTPSMVTNLINSLISYVKEDQPKRKHGLEAELIRLEEVLPRVGALQLDAIDNDPFTEERIGKFKEAIYKADDLMDELDYHRLVKEIKGKKSTVSHVLSGFIITLQRAVHLDPTLERLKEVVKGLDKAVAEIGMSVRSVATLNREQFFYRRPTSFYLYDEMIGRDDEKHKIINKLLNFSSAFVTRNFSILPIVGVGGIGKTTLAQSVYNDERIENHFDQRMWVCVSNTFNVLTITRRILLILGFENIETANLIILQDQLFKRLRSKKVLLVLDDVWNENDMEGWEQLLKPFNSVEAGSMILLTTRSERVAKMVPGATMNPIFLKGLSDADYWELFKICAFEDRNYLPQLGLEDIGRKIVEKLKGSPLAARTVGAILRRTLDHGHWKKVLNSGIWDLEQGEYDIMPGLRLSYMYLPSHLKSCFKFCSIFPQDYEFDREQLIYMWIALGLVQTPIHGNKQLEDIGDEYFDDLVVKSFFDCKTRGLRTHYVMHDLLHELAQYVSRHECFRIEINSGHVHIPLSVIHLSINCDFTPHIPEITKLKNLRTLLFLKSSNPSCYISDVLKLRGLTSLRILRVYNVNITSDCISSLKHLRYLSIFDVLQVPKAVNKLYHLQCLYHKPSQGSSNSPNLINDLVNLRRLFTPNSLSGDVSGIGRLTSLQVLEKFEIEEEDGRKISELKNLRELRELGIHKLQNASSVEEVVEAKLNDKVHLQKLTLEWAYIRTDRLPEHDEQVLDALQPYCNLRNLKINNYMGRFSPHWMTPQSLSKLVSINLSNCKRWQGLLPLGQLSQLESLHLSAMNSVKRIGSALDGEYKVGIFPSLKELHINSMPALEEFYGEARTGQWLPHLINLSVYGCPKLRAFPNLPYGLRELNIDSVNWTALPQLWDRGSWSINISASLPSASSSSPPLSWSSLFSLKISSCPFIESLAEGLLQNPELFISLEELSISNCIKLRCLPLGVRKFISLNNLTMKCCPKLQGPGKASSSSSSSFSSSSLILDKLVIDDLSLLHTMPLEGISAHKVSLGPCKDEVQSSTLAEWVLKNPTSLQMLEMTSVSSEQFPLVDLRSLSRLRHLNVGMCKDLQSLPELPSSLTVLSLSNCPPVLEERCLRDSGEDWPKIQHIPDIKIGNYTREQLETTTPAGHRSRMRELEEVSSK
ncbi:putative disease resistance protein RGA1 [Typha latifolia]|uniref:putative disease resistance protein RGA1 n=1 Tax=Typha latifolia TaxID=4733 RepID=UPI003C2CC09F